MSSYPAYQRFFAELKRRHVFRMVAVYGVVGFAVLQAIDLVVPALLLPDWTYRFVALFVFAGFPIALLITWAFEIRPDGIRLTAAAEPGELEAIAAQPAARRWPAGLFAVLGLALLTSGWWLGRRTAPDPEARPAVAADRLSRGPGAKMTDLADDTRPSIAVLPFADMSERNDQAYFSDGITEELLDVLTKLRALRVAARTSAFAFKDQKLTAEQLGDTLHVDYLLEGSVRKAGDELRITAQLVDAADGSHVWSETYDRKLDDVFTIQSEIAGAIAEQLRVSLGLAADELVHPTKDLEAYDLYLAGRARVRERGAGLRDAVRLFEGAIARDSTWAPAWAGLAEADELRQYYPVSWEDQPASGEARFAIIRAYQDAAEAAAERAIALDPNSVSAHVALGSVYRTRRQWEASEREYVRALALDPDDAELLIQYTDMLASCGRISESLATSSRAVQLDPAPIRLSVASISLWADGQYEAALALLRRAIAADPDHNVSYPFANWYMINMLLGRYEDAVRFGLPSGDGVLGVTRRQHEALVDALKRGSSAGLPATTPEESLLIMVIWRKLGDRDRGLAGLEGYVERYPFDTLAWMWTPDLDPLRDDPRYLAVLRRMNLEGATPQRTGGGGG